MGNGNEGETMNGKSLGVAGVPKDPGSVIKPWLSVGLVVALVTNASLSAVLILNLDRFDAVKQKAVELEAASSRKRGELAELQAEVEKLTNQKETLAPSVADWEQRLKEKADAQAAVASLAAQKQQIESDIAVARKRLAEANQTLAAEEKHRSELQAEIEKLRADAASLLKSNTDVKAVLALAADAERRRTEAELAVTNAGARLRQLQAEIASTDKWLAQIRQETDAHRQSRDDLAKELATVRQQRQMSADELTDLQKQIAQAKVQQTAIRQAEEILTGLRQQAAAAEARAREIEERSATTQATLSNLVARVAEIRQQAAEWEVRRDAAKSELSKTEADLSAARKVTQELVAKQAELTRDLGRLEAEIEKRRKEKEALEKEIGRLEAQRPKPAPNSQP